MASTPKKKTPAKKKAPATKKAARKTITKTSQIAASEGGKGGTGSKKALANLMALKRRPAKKKAAASPAAKKKAAPARKKVAAAKKKAARPATKLTSLEAARRAVRGKAAKKKAAPAKKKAAPAKKKATPAKKKAVPKKSLKEQLAGAKTKAVKVVTKANAKRVLAVHPDVEVLRVVREGLAEDGIAVETSPTPERAFERALQRKYALFLFGVDVPKVPGEVLYEMIALSYKHTARPSTAPGIIYVGEAIGADQSEELRREARVKGVLVGELTEKRVRDAVGKALARKR